MAFYYALAPQGPEKQPLFTQPWISLILTITGCARRGTVILENKERRVII
jgi:hypothetical protein